MKWDGRTIAVVGSAVVTIVTLVATVIGTAIALGAMIQTEHARIDTDIRELRAGLGDLDQRMDARFDAMDTRLDNMGTRLDAMDAWLDGLGERLARVETLMVNFDRRLYRLEDHLFGIETEPAQPQ